VVRGSLVVAGGANFPERPPWEGGTKVWHDMVLVLDSPRGTWRTASPLATPRAYGASWSTRRGLVMVGGGDSWSNTAECRLLDRMDGQPGNASAPPALPIALANPGFASDERSLLVLGGQESPGATTASQRVFRLTNERTWRWDECPPLPGSGGRILPWVARLRGGWCAGGGAALVPGPDGTAKRQPWRDAWWLGDGKSGWESLPDTPMPVIAAPCPAPTSRGRVVLLPADDTSLAGVAQAVHPGFPKRGWILSARRDRWDPLVEFPFAQVTTSTVRWRGRWAVPTGEIRPGVRTTAVPWGDLP